VTLDSVGLQRKPTRIACGVSKTVVVLDVRAAFEAPGERAWEQPAGTAPRTLDPATAALSDFARHWTT
jgi:hypothetical protein